MKLPRDMGGDELAAALSSYGYRITRQKGSHLRLTSNLKGKEHHITIPRHKPLRTGTLNSILHEVALYLDVSRQTLLDGLQKS